MARASLGGAATSRISRLTRRIVWGLFAEWWGLQMTVKAVAVAVDAMLIGGAALLRVRARRYG